jgi:hypothetical protein
MPHYYFYFGDGKRTFTDSTGIELNGIAAARAHAKSQIRSMMATLPGGRLQIWSGWKMIVADANGKTLFEVSFDLTPRTR